MNRQEPVIDTSARLLNNRVRLTWREVREIASGASPKEPTLGAAPAAPEAVAEPVLAAKPAPAFAPAETSAEKAPRAAEPLVLTDEERAAIAAIIVPRIEATVRIALRDVLDVALANAVTRVKVDVERSLGQAFTQAIAREIDALDLSEIIRR